MDIAPLRQQLYDLDEAVRSQALAELIDARLQGQIAFAPPSKLVNLHCHTCYSYNAFDHTPASLAWLAAEQGWHALATVDFDVLDAVDETLLACDRVGVRGAAGMETRVYVPELADKEINSPGEPGICYFVGVGFARQTAPAGAAMVLEEMRAAASQRNRDMVARINALVGPAAIDYERDVLPLTPSGNATERHMLVAYDAAARKAFPNRRDLIDFWSQKLGVDAAQLNAALGPEPGPNELLRSKLMKRGGVGYVQPGPQSFPQLSRVSETISACGALPTYAWLDGSSAAEQNLDELLRIMMSYGVVGLTVIPERNWHYSDPASREAHVRKLDQLMARAAQLDLPIFIGTEMNKAGQPLVDQIWSTDALRPYAAAFIAGADLLYGHTLLERVLGSGFSSAWAAENLPDRQKRNRFYERFGSAAEPGEALLRRVQKMGAALLPAELLQTFGSTP